MFERKKNSKVIKETKLNNNSADYGNLIWPCSVTTTHNDEILCADTHGNRVLVFNREFIFKYQIGKYGSMPGEFNEPSDLIINELGKLFVADKNNYRVQVFNETKKFRDLTKKHSVNSLSKRTTKIYKSDTEFVFACQIELNDKPIKLTSAPLATVCAVSTENGFIFIINSRYQLSAFLKLNSINYVKNICMNSIGNELIYVYFKNTDLCMKFYHVDDELDSEQPHQSASNDLISKLKMKKKIKMEKNYLPGISLAAVGQIKLSLDLQSLIIFDTINLNLLEYDINTGRFKRIILKAENYLSNVLAFDFSTDRQHLLSVEVDYNKKFYFSQVAPASDRGIDQKNLLNLNCYNFKMKLYKYMDCECHRSRLDNSKNRSTLDKSVDLNDDLSDSFDLFE